MTDQACPICRTTDLELVGPYRTTSTVMARRQKVRCRNCTLVFVSPLPSAQEWQNYNSDYFNTAHGTSHMAPRAVEFRSALGKIRAAHVREHANSFGMTIDRVLEIGPGYGEFAAAWMAAAPVDKYTAIETDRSLHPLLRAMGVEIMPSIEAVISTGQKYDLVVASHVLEHTLNPVQFLKDMAVTCGSNGLIFIEVPCQDYLYKPFDEPHTMFFDKASLQTLCQEAGLAPPPLLTYHGEPREELQADLNRPYALRILLKILSKARYYLHAGGGEKMLEFLTPQERAVIQNHAAHICRSDASRWVRMLVRNRTR